MPHKRNDRSWCRNSTFSDSFSESLCQPLHPINFPNAAFSHSHRVQESHSHTTLLHPASSSVSNGWVGIAVFYILPVLWLWVCTVCSGTCKVKKVAQTWKRWDGEIVHHLIATFPQKSCNIAAGGKVQGAVGVHILVNLFLLISMIWLTFAWGRHGFRKLWPWSEEMYFLPKYEELGCSAQIWNDARFVFF